MGNITLKFNNGSPLVLHEPSGDSVLLSELKLHTEPELEALKARLERLERAPRAERVALSAALMQLAAEREAHARTLAAARDALAQMGGRPKSCGHKFECICVGDNLKAAIAAAKVTP